MTDFFANASISHSLLGVSGTATSTAARLIRKAAPPVEVITRVEELLTRP